jgi:hypothetical protein
LLLKNLFRLVIVVSAFLLWTVLKQDSSAAARHHSVPSVDSANPNAIAVLPFQNAAVRELQ